MTPVLTVARRYRRAGDKAVRQIDWRHLVGALVRKPQAFRHSVFRDDLFPTVVFRRAWEALDDRLDPGKACRIYVGLLHLAATHACEDALNRYLDSLLDAGQLPDLETVRTAVAPVPTALPRIAIPAPDLRPYDRLLTVVARPEIPT